MRRPFAHRGLHGSGIPENSIAAFQRAVDGGCGIELDVRLSADGEMMIHHDASLLRMAGVDRNLADLTAREIQSLRLQGTQERVPTFQEALRVIQGRVPLIVELKSNGGKRHDLPEKVAACMEQYAGQWCVESFDPRLLWWFRRHAPRVIRGQLAFDPWKKGERGKNALHFLGAHLLFNAISRPDFVAYDHTGDGNFSFRLMRTLFHPFTVGWTVRSKEAYQQLRKRYDALIFEGFDPLSNE